MKNGERNKKKRIERLKERVKEREERERGVLRQTMLSAYLIRKSKSSYSAFH